VRIPFRPFTTSPSELRLLIEDLCGYRLPWGLNSILVLLKSLEVEIGRTLPQFVRSSRMVKYGLSDPVGVCLLPYLTRNEACSELARFARTASSAASDLAWILSVTPNGTESRAGCGFVKEV